MGIYDNGGDEGGGIATTIATLTRDVDAGPLKRIGQKKAGMSNV